MALTFSFKVKGLVTMVTFFFGIKMGLWFVCRGLSDGPAVSMLTNGMDTPEERYSKLRKVG